MYVFGDCAVDPRRFELRRGDATEHIEPQVFDVLVYLIRHRGRVVSKNELLDQVWGDRFVRFLETFSGIDVTEVAPTVACPTLVVHSRDDQRVPLSSARELVTLIPDAQFVTLPSRNHILTSNEPAWPQFLDEVSAFLLA